jgi:putative oxidoreductase
MHNQPFPMWFSSVLVYLLPAVELFIAGMLLFERSRYMGLWASAILMGLFTVYTCLVLCKVFYKVPCSCGGVIRNLTWGWHLVFNIFFVFVSIVAI